MYTKSRNPLAVLAVILALVSVIGLLIWFFAANAIVSWHIYPRGAEFLNLRDRELSLEEYDKISKKLPDCEIYWDIPFQGKTYPENTTALEVTELSDEDVDTIGYFRHLEVINAMDCTDYAQIAQLQSRYPDVVVGYVVYVNDVPYASDASEVALTALTEREIELLQYLPDLTAVDMGACEDYALLETLMETYPQLSVTVKLGDEKYSSDVSELTVTGMTDGEASSLAFFSNLTKLHLVDPVMDPQTLLGLKETYPNAAVTWEMDVLGVTLRSDDKELELIEAISQEGAKAYEMAASAYVQGKRDETVMLFASNSKYPVPDRTQDTAQLIEQVETALAYFPAVERVSMRGAFLDNEAMAAFREAHREDYKVVWTVDCGSLVVSTDTTYVMPYKFGVAYFFDEETYNLRYCEDVICVDMGHMAIHNADFAQYMPKLKYLILAHTQIMDISPLEHCKSLVFLELDWSIVRDYTPLLGCTALEDLNLGKTYADITPILEMDWLKHLWILDRSADVQIRLQERFGETETELYMNGMYTAGGGWRDLPNYYAMRDALNMPYMEM